MESAVGGQQQQQETQAGNAGRQRSAGAHQKLHPPPPHTCSTAQHSTAQHSTTQHSAGAHQKLHEVPLMAPLPTGQEVHDEAPSEAVTELPSQAVQAEAPLAA